MRCLGEVDRLVERAGLDADDLGRVLLADALVPKPAAAIGAEGARQGAAAIGRPVPGLEGAARHPQGGARNEQRYAEGRRRLLAAFQAVADAELGRRRSNRIADPAALAAADQRFLWAGLEHGSLLLA